MLFRDTAVAQGDAFLAMFAINSVSSWYSLKELRNKIVRENDDDETVPMVIVANKRVRGLGTSLSSHAQILSRNHGEN